jgi:tetratricopeptide (TPR) repeat protein/predicted Ser/Thr protein kinase
VEGGTPDPEQAPVRLGHYVLLHKLGRGGMGVVYAAYDERLDRRVAIKLLRTRGRAKAERRLIREAQALARLSHPNVVQIHDVGNPDEQPFLVMELIEGVTLDEWRKEQPRTRAEILAVFLAAGRGLAAAHQNGLVHRDFKPDNVMIRRDGQVVVMDFGLARGGDDRSEAPLIDELELSSEHDEGPSGDSRSGDSDSGSSRSNELQRPLTAAGAVVGTPGYMAPEQLFGGEVRDRCDQFSFCAALWEALFDKRPFRGRHLDAYARSLLRDHPKPPDSSDVPAWLRKVLERGLAREPNDRWPSMNALLDALQADPSRRRRRLAATVGLLACAAAIVVGIVVADQRERDRLDRERADQLAACARDGEAILADWNEETARGIEQAFLATSHPFAQSAWQHTQPWLENYARAWADVHTQTCVETTIDRSRSADSQAAVADCLDEGRLAFVGVLDVLSGLAAEHAQVVTSATLTASRLPAPANCTDESLLRHLRRPPAELRETIVELRTRLERARARSYAGDHTRALDEAQAVLTEAQTLAWSPLLVQTGSLVALLHFRLGKFEEAKLAAEQAVLTAAASDDVLGIVVAAAELTAALGGLAQYDEARRWALLAQALIERHELVGTTYEAQVLTRLAAVLSEMGAHAEALPHQQRALTIYETVLGPEHPTIALVLLNLGVTQDRLGEHRAALASFNRGIEIVKVVQGPEHSNLGYLYNSVGATSRTMGDLEGSLAAHQRGLTIWEATLGSEHPSVAIARTNIGVMLCMRNQCEEGLIQHERALATLEAKQGPEHPQVGTTHLRIGQTLFELQSYDQALEHHRRALTILTASKGAEHHDALAARSNIAEVLREQGHAAEAVAELRAVLEVLERTDGPTHMVRDVLVELGLALLEAGEISSAREQLERALPMYEQDHGGVERAKALFALARVSWAAGEQDRARALAEDASALYRSAGEFGTRGLTELDAWLRENQLRK